MGENVALPEQGLQIEPMREGDFLELLHRSNVEEEFNKLPDEIKVTVRNGVGFVWQLDSAGEKVNYMDHNNMGAIGQMKQALEEADDDLRRGQDWKGTVTKEFVELAAEDNRDKRKSHGETITMVTSGYNKTQGNIHGSYMDMLNYLEDDRGKVESYLNRRYTYLNDMQDLGASINRTAGALFERSGKNIS